MARVYVGRHRVTGKPAAIKLLDAGLTDEDRFLREASATADIGHPDIVDIFDAGRDPETGAFYIAMELLEGETLREHMEDEATTPGQILRLIRRSVVPLCEAHARGFVHRDLKPENIFVVGERQQVKLLDFGIARRMNASRMTATGTSMGTPHYMSPEQAMDAGKVSAASDVWSVGVMIYEALSGAPPFDGETIHAVIVAACTQDHVPLAERVPEVDPALSELVDRCLAKTPSDRPATAGALLAELDRLLPKCSLPASRPPSNLALPRGTERRRPA